MTDFFFNALVARSLLGCFRKKLGKSARYPSIPFLSPPEDILFLANPQNKFKGTDFEKTFHLQHLCLPELLFRITETSMNADVIKCFFFSVC